MVEVSIPPVAYAQVQVEDWLPGMRPYVHQWEADRHASAALGERTSLCIFLVTPTGSGKTLAAYAPSIRLGEPAIGVYPTNELLADQARALEPFCRLRGPHPVLRVDSGALERWQVELELQRHGETLETLLHWGRVVLTNPDILFQVAFGLYPGPPPLAQRLWSVLGGYRLFLFDEFHLYSVKQRAEVAFLVGALHAIKPDLGRVVVFASATPDPEMVAMLRDRLGLPVRLIEAVPAEGPHARRAGQAITLRVMPAELERWQVRDQIEAALDQLRAFRARYPEARVLFILDSVAAAVAVAQRLRGELGPDEVGEVHGLSSQAMREEALLRRATVGTSTIEVGVDFKDDFEKDCLVFEARTASSFLQRLGRIGRHEKGRPIPNLAIALVPGYVYEFLAAKLGTGAEVSREQLRDLIEEAYRRPEEFQGYLGRYGSVPMAEAMQLVRSMFQPDDLPRIEGRLGDIIRALTGDPPRTAMGKCRRLAEAGVLPPLLTFRGAGLEAAILDMRGRDPGCPAKRYDVVFLLRRGVFEELDERSYQAELDRLEGEHPEWAAELARERRFGRLISPREDDLLGVWGFFRLTGLLSEARRVWFEVPEEELLGKKGQVTVLQGLEIRTDPPVHLRLLNRTLRRKRMVAWVMDIHPTGIRFGRALPPLFAVYELRLLRPGGGPYAHPWSIAFNQNAFFLDSLRWNLRRIGDVVIV